MRVDGQRRDSVRSQGGDQGIGGGGVEAPEQHRGLWREPHAGLGEGEAAGGGKAMRGNVGAIGRADDGDELHEGTLPEAEGRRRVWRIPFVAAGFFAQHRRFASMGLYKGGEGRRP